MLYDVQIICCQKEVKRPEPCSPALCFLAIFSDLSYHKTDCAAHICPRGTRASAQGVKRSSLKHPRHPFSKRLAQLNVFDPEKGLKETDCLNQILMTHSYRSFLHGPNTFVTHAAPAHTYNMFPQHTHSHLCTPCSSTLGISEHCVR